MSESAVIPLLRHTFLVERYAPDLGGDQVLNAGRRAAEAASLLSPGANARYIGSLLLPSDEMSLCLFHGVSEAVMRHALEQSPLAFERITEAIPVRRFTRHARNEDGS